MTSAQIGQPVTVTSPGSQEGLAGTSVSVPVSASDSNSGQTPAFTASGLPAGTSISASGTITGKPTTAGTSTVTVKAADGTGAQASTTFTWTVLPSTDGTGAQVWQPQSDGALRNPQSGSCLDDTGYGGSGTQTQIWSCTGNSNQSWTLP